MSREDRTTVAIACQGGGSHTAFTAGALQEIIRNCPDEYDITALSGTSGGAMCAALAWDGLRRDDPDGAIDRLTGFWDDISTKSSIAQLSNEWSLWTGRLTSKFGTVGTSPYWNPFATTAEQAFRETIERHVRFDDGARDAPPHLFVGAVNVESGSFEVFADGEEGASALLASAAIPNLFRAVEINGMGHWDGLFSQNPPIRHFTSDVAAEQKPDEIWIIRIEPVATGETPRDLDEIADRRNQLSGNLSLEQEKHMIESINEFIDRGIIDHQRYKPIELREVGLERKLDTHSKLDRSPEFLQGLMASGRRKASAFWTDRDDPVVVPAQPVSD